MKRYILITAALLLAVATTMAQPKKSRVGQNSSNSSASKSTAKASDEAATQSRAALMFPTAVAVPDEVPWRRDIYRTLDLANEANAPLYYPTEPRDGQMSLFTILFRLLNVGKIPAYKYDINSGVENYTKDNRLHFKDMLDSYDIPYEIQDNAINVLDYDVPSSEVLSYYVKESTYYDEWTATYHTRVTALCPVLHRADDFSFDERKYPLFWVRFDDVEPYLQQFTLQTSSLNNAAHMSVADFFATNQYDGKIYMTNNLHGRSLQQQFPTDSLMAQEQARIEKEMADFESHLWATPLDSAQIAERDSIANAQTKGKKAKKSRTSRSARSKKSEASSSDSGASSSSASASSSPRVSVRRQRH